MAPVPSHVKTPLPTNRTAPQSLMCVVEYTSREVRARTSSYGTLCFAYVGDGRSVYVLGKGAMWSIESVGFPNALALAAGRFPGKRCAAA